MAIKQIPGLRGPDTPTKFAVRKGPFQDPAQNYTLTCATGAYVYAGVNATLTVQRRLAAAAGAYVIAGQAASLRVDRKLALATGAYNYAGIAATLTYVSGAPGAVNYTLALATGAYAYARQSAILTYVNKAPALPVQVTPYFDVMVTAKQTPRRKLPDLRLLLIG